MMAEEIYIRGLNPLSGPSYSIIIQPRLWVSITNPNSSTFKGTGVWIKNKKYPYTKKSWPYLMNKYLPKMLMNISLGPLTTSTLYYSLIALAAGELHEIRGKHT
jgi:hypothetical protein